jgi:hypothetical protein
MAKRKNRDISVKFVFGNPPHDPILINGMDEYGPSSDRIAVLPYPVDSTLVDQILTEFTESKEKIKNLVIIAPPGRKVDINPVLNSEELVLTDNSTIDITGIEITGEMFRALCQTYEDLHFDHCNFVGDWFLPSIDPAVCKSLTLSRCDIEGAADIFPGSANLLSLSSLSVFNKDWSQELTADSALPPEEWESRPFFPTSEGVQFLGQNLKPGQYGKLISAFVHPGIKRISLDRCADIQFLASLPTVSNLEDLHLDMCPLTPDVLEWIGHHSGLTSLRCAWTQDVELDWSAISSMTKLRWISIGGSGATDQALSEILKHGNIKNIHADDSRLTAGSWEYLLRHKSLRFVLSRSSMLEGEYPSDPPAKTGLREILPLNVSKESYDKLCDFMSRYPKVNVVREFPELDYL